MLIGEWFWAAMAAAFLWGMMGFLPKLAVGTLPPMSAFVYEVLGAVTVGLVVLAFLGFRPEFNWKGAIWSYVAGACGFGGTLAYFYAVSKGPVSMVALVTSLYLLVPVVLGVLFLHEILTLKQVIGCALALVGMVLVVL